MTEKIKDIVDTPQSGALVVPDQIISMEDVLKVVVKQKDFVDIKGSIEITRDFALKLFTLGKLTYDANVEEVTHDGDFMVFIIKATVSKNGQSAVGFGACSTYETKDKISKEEKKQGGQNNRQIHDALATAETRAYKRALEMIVGLPFINDVIQEIFGEFKKPDPSKEPLVDNSAMKILHDQMLENISDPHFAGPIEFEGKQVDLDELRIPMNKWLSEGNHSLAIMTKSADNIARMLLVAEERDIPPAVEVEPEDGKQLNDEDVQKVFEGEVVDVETEGDLTNE